MEYAIILSGGKQFKVTPGMKLDVDNLKQTGKEAEFKNVLLHVSGDIVKIGKPYISGMTIHAKVLGNKKGEKIRVSKFKGKARYRKTIGFRASLTTLEFLPFSVSHAKDKK